MARHQMSVEADTVHGAHFQDVIMFLYSSWFIAYAEKGTLFVCILHLYWVMSILKPT